MKSNKKYIKILVAVICFLLGCGVITVIKINTINSKNYDLPLNITLIKDKIKQEYYHKVNDKEWANDYKEYLQQISK